MQIEFYIYLVILCMFCLTTKILTLKLGEKPNPESVD